jgi:hypothetical protein
MVNRRNAMLGWAVLKLGRWAARRKLRSVAPSPSTRTRLGAGLAGGAAILVGILAFRSRRRDG